MSGEILSAYTTEDGDDIVALLFQTRYGAFTRNSKRWTALHPRDSRFDGLAVYDVLMDRAQELVKMFDESELKLADVQDMLATEPLEDTKQKA